MENPLAFGSAAGGLSLRSEGDQPSTDTQLIAGWGEGGNEEEKLPQLLYAV